MFHLSVQPHDVSEELSPGRSAHQPGLQAHRSPVAGCTGWLNLQNGPLPTLTQDEDQRMLSSLLGLAYLTFQN